MDSELEIIKKAMRDKRGKKEFKPKENKTTSFKLDKHLIKFLIIIVLTVTILITLKANKQFNSYFYQKVYNDNFSFATINKWYQDSFGSPIPFQNLFKSKTELVFKETLKYEEASKYKDGVKLTVEKNYLVPALETGLIIYIGEKEDYGNTIIIQQTSGIDLWYSNIDKVNVKIYDYIEKGDLIGETKDETLYLIYQKDGKNLDYTKYLP